MTKHSANAANTPISRSSVVTVKTATRIIGAKKLTALHFISLNFASSSGSSTICAFASAEKTSPVVRARSSERFIGPKDVYKRQVQVMLFIFCIRS